MTAYLTSHAYIAVLAPLALAAVLALVGRSAGRFAPYVALPGPVLAGAVGVACLVAKSESVAGRIGWLSSGRSTLSLAWRVDGLAALMLLVVAVVATMVMVFSVGYMHGERGYVRYFALLSLFTASMNALVLADSLVVLFVGWELVGACSYLLIGFWYDKPSAAEAARKAFIVTRIGDAGFLLGMGLLWTAAGTLSVPSVLAAVPSLPPALVTTAALLLFLGAVGKSAQFPLHVWLPDAMEGPTPVSALIHAATMVAAGVYLLVRMWPLFEASAALPVVLGIGAFTALAAATVALTQSDIKKVLAYSTISQLGFMFAALGAGAPEVAMFHLITHAAFKSLLFLASGSVIHGSGTQDLREMGGLVKRMPVTAACWIAGVLALAGIPPLAGFFSKDEVIASVLHVSPWAGAALVAASVLTGAYAARATRLAFFGPERGEAHAHESGPSMTVPLGVLAVLAVVLGWFSHPIAAALGGEAEGIDLAIAGMSVAAAVAGAATGWFVWSRDPQAENSFGTRLQRVWRVASGGYGADAFADRSIVKPVMSVARVMYASLDRIVIDGAVEGLARLAIGAGGWFRRLQSGEVQWYGALVVTGAVAAMALAMWLGR